MDFETTRSDHFITFIWHTKKPKPCITLWKNTTGISGTRGKCTKHEPQVRVFYNSRVFPNVWSVLSKCNTRLRLLHFLYDTEVMWRKTVKQAFSIFSNKTWVFDQSERAQSIKWKNKLYQSKVCPRLSPKSGQKAWFSAERKCPVHLLVRALCNKHESLTWHKG